MDLISNPAEPIRTWDLVELGTNLEALIASTQATRLTDDELGGALDRLDRVHDTLRRFDLRNAMDYYDLEVLPLAREIRSRQRLKGLADLGMFTEDVRSHAIRLLAKIKQDGSQKQAFLVRPAGGGLDASAVLLDPYSLFGLPGRVTPPLPRVCDYYLQEASRCFAVDFGIATAMLIATAVETLLRYYFELVTGEKPSQHTKWSSLEDRLKRIVTVDSQRMVISASEQVRDMRNKIAHGDVEAVSVDAQEIFLAARRAIKLIIEDLTIRGKLDMIPSEAAQLGLEVLP